MELILPELPGLSALLLRTHRRRPGSVVSPTSISTVFSVIVKQSYAITPSAITASLGSLTPRGDGPGIFEADQSGNLLQGDVAGGLVENISFGRQWRDRSVGISAMVEGSTGLALPQITFSAGGQSIQSDSGVLPGASSQPFALSAYERFSSSISSSTGQADFNATNTDGDTLTLSAGVVSTVEYESDLVPFKPEADLIVICDTPPEPVSLSINGTIRFEQTAVAPELTGLGWENRMGTPREAEAGNFQTMTQALPDAFDNRYFNGYRRDRRQGGTVPYLASGDELVLNRQDGVDEVTYAFTLPAQTPRLQHHWFTGAGVDDPCLWRARDVALAMDTLVIEPDRDHAYAVWRACWETDDPLDGFGPVAEDQNRQLAITMEEV